MGVEDKQIPVSHVLRAIDDQLEKANRDYYVAKGQEDHDKAGRAAEVKWCLAELKLDIIEKVVACG